MGIVMKKNENSEITQEELMYLSRQFANMFAFPVRLYHNKDKIYFYSPVNITVDPVDLCINQIIEKNDEVSYYVYDSFWYYGIVNHKSYKFIAGPVSEVKVSDNDLKKLGFLLNINKNDIFLFVSEMRSLSGIHLDTLIQSIILYNFSVNRSFYDVSDIRINDSEQNNISSNLKEDEISMNAYAKFYSNYARSYSTEKDMIKKVINGDVEGLIDGAKKIPSVSSGNLASHLIRHQKNFFIKLETIIARAGIEAGLDIDEVFSLEEMYIQKCESIEDIDRIKNLQYHMVIDYADRVNKLNQHNENSSAIVNEVSKYIKNHISEPIKTSDIADYLKKSRGRITTEFKKQTGINLSDFINIKKIQEAEELLCQTSKSLVFISNYLGFSSQSHFCKIFKEVKGITPREYREKNHPNITKI